MPGFNAEIPELVRSQRKDDDHVAFLRKSFNSLAQYSLGPQVWIKWQKEINVLAEFSYYLTTTLSGLQTLGEEYVTLIQVHGNQPYKVPSFIRRLTFVAVQVLGPFVYGKMLSKTKRYVNAENSDENIDKIFSFFQRSGLQYLHRIHLAIFYITGGYYHFAKRLLGVRYLSLRAQSHLDVLKIFKWLGVLSIVEMALSLFLWSYTTFKLTKNKKLIKRLDYSQDSANISAANTKMSENAFRCDMCLEFKPPACTPCGHLFCWDCLIVQAVELKSCPICRMAIAPSRIVPLLNL